MNAFVLVAEPYTVVTITSTGPAVTLEGVLHVILVEEAITIFEASTPPNLTEVNLGSKLVPVIVTLVPPNVEPKFGEM